MSSLIFSGLDVFAFYIFLIDIFRRKVEKNKLLICFFIAIIGVWVINIFGNPWLNILAVPFPLCWFAVVVFSVSLYRGIIYTFIYHIIFACGREMAFEMIYRLLMSLCPQVCERIFPAEGISFFIAEYLFSFSFLLYLGRYTKKLELPEEGRNDWYLLIMPIASILILFSFVYTDFPNEIIMQLLICSGAFLLYFSNAVIFVMLANFTVAMNKVKLTELSLLKKDLDIVHFNNMEKLNEVYRKYMHDVHRYFYQIRDLAAEGDNKLIMRIIDEVEGQIKDEERGRVYVENSVLNSLLVTCNRKAESRGVTLVIKNVENIDIDFIRDSDKISMFGNLLDNAVEAASKCMEGKRKVEITFFMGSKYILYFEIRNTWDGIVKWEGKSLLSTKRDVENHGLGINIVKELAHKYGGSLELAEEGEWFVSTLYVSNILV